MTRMFEAAFTVGAPRSEVWRALEAGRSSTGGWWLPAFESHVEEIKCEPERCLRARKVEEPCAGTEIAITLEVDGNGTRITVVQSGFGDWFDAMRSVLTIGWGHIVADLALYFEHGVTGRRHLLAWADPGAGLIESEAGLVVDGVQLGGWAARHGLETGDVIVAVGNAPIVRRADLETALRVLPPGLDVATTWVRSGQLTTSR